MKTEGHEVCLDWRIEVLPTSRREKISMQATYLCDPDARRR